MHRTTSRPWQRQFAGQSLVLVVALLPALVAGVGIARAAAPGEWERLAAALTGARPIAASLVADGFLLATVPAGAPVPLPDSVAAEALLGSARIGQVLGIVALSFLGYLAMMLAGGRARSLLAVAWLAVLPPIAGEGHVLRPETPSVVFGLLALLLLQCVSGVQRPASTARARATVTFLLCATAAVAIGFAVAALPSAGILLLLPGGASIMATALLVLRLLRALRQRSIAVLPIRAGAARLWPWVLASMASLLATVLLLDIAVRAPEALSPTGSGCGLLPALPVLRYPLSLLAVLGAARLLLRTGQRLGRRGRLGADFLLLLYCASLLAQRVLRPTDDDALPAALPMALLLAEGTVHATLLIAGRRSVGAREGAL